MRTLTVVLTGLALSLTACGDEGGSSGSADPGGAGGAGGIEPSLAGRSFLATSVTADGKPKTLAPGTRIRLQFMADGRLLADAGCNSMQGPVSTGAAKLTVRDLSMTEMGCDGPRHAQDEWLAGFLEAGPSWQLTDGRLSVTSGTSSVVLRDRAETAPPLEGTRWTVESVIHPPTASHPMNAEKAHLTITGNQVSGSAGCNGLSGKVTRNGDKLTFGPLGTTRMSCGHPADDVEMALLRTLKGEVTFTIDGDRLSLRGPDGSGVDLVAR